MELTTINLLNSVGFESSSLDSKQTANKTFPANAKSQHVPLAASYVFSELAFTSQALKEKWTGYSDEFTKNLSTGKNPAAANISSWPQDASSASTSWSGDLIAFENEGYNINLNDTGEINIHNKQTGEHYRIWGDPHVDVDGKRAFDFKGDTTFVLDDGTKVTIETTPWRGNNGQTISSKVSIIDGKSDYAVHITGVDDHHKGDLQFEEVPGFGRFLDAMIDDGNYVHENPEGRGFIAVGQDGWAEVDQSMIDFIENRAAELTGLFQQEDSGSPDGTSLNEAGTTFSLEQLQAYLSERTSNNHGNAMQDNLLSTLDSLLSLIKSESRQFAQFSGLNHIENRGEFNFSSFSFTLNFSRT